MVNKRQFVCQEGKFNKYWDCWVELNRFVAEWGGIGLSNNKKSWPYSSPYEAQKKMESMIRQKTKKKKPGNRHGTYIEVDLLSENKVKHIIADWLESQQWEVSIAWRKLIDPDIIATKNDEKWIIQAKGQRSRPHENENCFISVLGEISQKMIDPQAQYYIAVPGIGQFKKLWAKFPKYVKDSLGIKAIFVDEYGKVEIR